MENPLPTLKGYPKHLYLPAGMLQHDATTDDPSFPAQLAGTPLIFPVGRHPERESGKISVKTAECGRK